MGKGGRIDVSRACSRAMRLLAEGARSHGDVSASTGIGVQTVDLIAGAMSLHGAAAKAGWKSLPDSVLFSAIKSECYPVPPRDAWILARLIAEGAMSPDSAAGMPAGRNMRELVEAGHVGRAEGGFYLTGIGPSLAQGVLSMYPEMERPAYSRIGGASGLARRLVCATTRMPPPAPIAGKRRGAHAL